MKNRRRVSLAVSVLCSALALLLGARTHGQSSLAATPANQNSSSPSLRVTTRTVQVSVIPLDRDGHPVTGLTKDDFTLTDQGQEQKITYFDEETANREAEITTSISDRKSTRLNS